MHQYSSKNINAKGGRYFPVGEMFRSSKRLNDHLLGAVMHKEPWFLFLVLLCLSQLSLLLMLTPGFTCLTSVEFHLGTRLFYPIWLQVFFIFIMGHALLINLHFLVAVQQLEQLDSLNFQLDRNLLIPVSCLVSFTSVLLKIIHASVLSTSFPRSSLKRPVLSVWISHSGVYLWVLMVFPFLLSSGDRDS